MARPEAIVPLTYGVMPRTEFAKNPKCPFRLAGDSSLVAMATIDRYQDSDPNTQVIIPGATFFNGQAVDANLMKDYMSNRERGKANFIPPENIEAVGTCTNTPTQMAEIKRRQTAGQLGQVTIICAYWQRQDARSLMEAQNINGKLLTDEQILRHRRMGIFDHQFGLLNPDSAIAQTFGKKEETAKKLALMDKFDKKGLFRTLVLRRLIGIGISDWQFRGSERKADAHIKSRETWVRARRQERLEKARLS